MPPAADLTGLTFGRLTVISLKSHPPRRHKRWNCLCECGETTVVHHGALTSGHTRSCGCLRVEVTTANETTHDDTGSPEYVCWQNMKKRCYSQTNISYPAYGGRGIRVCPEWADSYERFLADMGRRPSPQHSLDRIDNDGHYTPENCRWTDRRTQLRNRSNSRLLTFKGRTQILADWATEIGISDKVLDRRLGLGWSVERALTEPLRRHGLQP